MLVSHCVHTCPAGSGVEDGENPISGFSIGATALTTPSVAGPGEISMVLETVFVYGKSRPQKDDDEGRNQPRELPVPGERSGLDDGKHGDRKIRQAVKSHREEDVFRPEVHE